MGPKSSSKNIRQISVDKNEYKHTLSDLDLVSPNTLVTSLLIYQVRTDNDIQRAIKSVEFGLQQAAEQLPPLKAQIQFESNGKPKRRLIEGSLKLKIRTFELGEHKSFGELAKTGFTPSEFHQPQLVPVEAYDKTDARPVLLAQLSIIPGGLILALGLNHVTTDGGGRGIALKLICSSAKAYLEGKPIPQSHFDYQRAVFRPRLELLALPRQQLLERLRDYAIIDTANAQPSPPSSTPPACKASIFRIQGAAVDRLKISCKPSNGALYLSSYDCVVGLLWRSVIRARCTSKPYLNDSKSRILCPVDLRGRGVDNNYFGNAVSVASAEPVPTKDLLGRDGLSLAASSIRRAIQDISIKSAANVTSLSAMMGPTERLHFMPRHGMLEGDFMVSNWHFMDTAKFDFGLGPPAAVRLPSMPAPGFAFIFPDCQRISNSRVYDIYVSLPVAEMDLLRNDKEFASWFQVFPKHNAMGAKLLSLNQRCAQFSA
ncbi:MAG: hypothetical protein Q9227_003079 [Pyrenula ochraceoflavens]